MCAITPSASVRLPVDGRAAGLARSFLRRSHCPVHGSPGVLDDAELLISELVTNAVRHGAPPITLHIACEGVAAFTARVTDTDPQQPELRHVGSQDETGRGIALVDLLSDAWGIDPVHDGKTVWFQLRTH